MLRDYLVDGLGTRQLEIEQDILVAGIELQGTFEPKDAMGNIVDAIVGTAKVVADIGSQVLLCQLSVEFDSCLIIGTSVCAVGLCLHLRRSDGLCYHGNNSKEKEENITFYH